MKKLHPASVAVRSLSRSLNTGFVFFVIGVIVSPGGNGMNLLSVFGLVLFGVVTGIVYEFAYYQRFRYELTADTFDVTSGVISRRDRELPLGRVQNVDIRQNVIERLLGIAAVHIETAGGGETEVSLQYVDEVGPAPQTATTGWREPRADRRDDDEALEDEVDAVDSAVEPSEDEEILFEIEPRELAILSVFTIDPGPASWAVSRSRSPADSIRKRCSRPTESPGFRDRQREYSSPRLGALALRACRLDRQRNPHVHPLLRLSAHSPMTNSIMNGGSSALQRDDPLDKVQTLTISESIPSGGSATLRWASRRPGTRPVNPAPRGTESAIPLADADRVVALARAIEPFGPVDLESPPRRASRTVCGPVSTRRGCDRRQRVRGGTVHRGRSPVVRPRRRRRACSVRRPPEVVESRLLRR